MRFVKIILYLAFVFLFFANCALFVEAKSFPQIRRTSVSISTNSATPEASETIIIRDIQGNPAYKLSLVTVSLNSRTTESINISLSTTGRYSPDAEEKYEPNLLNPDFWGHGDISFRPKELCLANRNDQLFGARREYILRRMRIVATVSDIELNEEGIVKMRMTVTVEPSASKRSRPKNIAWGERKGCSSVGS